MMRRERNGLRRVLLVELMGLCALVGLAGLTCAAAEAQLIGEPAMQQHQPPRGKKQKGQRADLEWMWQYSPPPAEGREHELIEDANFEPFLHEYFKAPQSFWGPGSESAGTSPAAAAAIKGRKSLADTAYDFLAVPDRVIADQNRYISVSGRVFHFPQSRGLVFADLDSAHPLVVFAAIEWIRSERPVTDAAAEYTLWIFPNQPPGTPQAPASLPPPLLRSLKRWMAVPAPGTDFPQKITHAILVEADGSTSEIAVPDYLTKAPPVEEGPPLPKRSGY